APQRGGDGNEHRVASVPWRRSVVRDLNGDLWRVDGPQDAERPDRQVVRFAVVVDGDAFRGDPTDRHVRGPDAVRAQHDLVERLAGPHAHMDTGCVDMSLGT